MSDIVITIQSPAMGQNAYAGIIDAGFWRRVIAWIIDWVFVSTCVSIVFLLLAAAIPGLGKVVTLHAPFGLFTTDRTIESKTVASRSSGKGVTETIVERTVVGQWTYLYRVTPSGRDSRTWQQIDPVTRQDIRTTGLRTIVTIVLFIYWILMEASRHQASLGKLALGLKVVDERGQGLTVPRAAGRNLLKVLSMMILLIGFLMAGWTRRKQALHDMITRCHVVVDR